LKDEKGTLEKEEIVGHKHPPTKQTRYTLRPGESHIFGG